MGLPSQNTTIVNSNLISLQGLLPGELQIILNELIVKNNYSFKVYKYKKGYEDSLEYNTQDTSLFINNKSVTFGNIELESLDNFIQLISIGLIKYNYSIIQYNSDHIKFNYNTFHVSNTTYRSKTLRFWIESESKIEKSKINSIVNDYASTN